MLTRKVVLQISCPAKHTRRQSIPRARHRPDLSVQLTFLYNCWERLSKKRAIL